MSVADVLFNRAKVLELNSRFFDQMKAMRARGGKGRVKGFDRETGALAIIGTPTVALAAASIIEAAEKAAELARSQGQGDLAEQQLQLLHEAVREAVESLDQHSSTIDSDDDPLFEAAAERLSEQLR